MSRIDYQVSDRGGVKVVSISGRLDATSASTVRPKLVELAEASTPAKVVVDLAGLEWIDSSGVGALVTLYKRARTGGGDVKVAGLANQPKEIFRLLRLDSALQSFETIDEAVAKLTSG